MFFGRHCKPRQDRFGRDGVSDGVPDGPATERWNDPRIETSLQRALPAANARLLIGDKGRGERSRTVWRRSGWKGEK